MGYFTLFEGSNGQYYFNLKASNGEVILQSEGYLQKASALSGIQSVKINTPYDSRYLRKRSVSGQYYFVLIANNGKVIGVSQMYSFRSSMENGVASVKSNAPSARIVDYTAAA